ncbi:MAG: hypothetical protein QNL92_06780 [Octadecabacter sp.]
MRSAYAFTAHRSFAALQATALALGLTPRNHRRAEAGRMALVHGLGLL